MQARAKLAALLRERKGGEVALVAYAEEPFTVAPLTADAALEELARTGAIELQRRDARELPDALARLDARGHGGRRLLLEPGRSLIANAGILVSEVVLVARKSRTAVERWVYTDVGKFSGLIETMDESIKFPIYTEKKGEMEEVIIAGPTCDSADIMYENYKYGLPLNLASGDRLYWFSTGAYTTSYSAVEFNGFPPLKAFYI